MSGIKAGEAYIQTSLRGGEKLRKDLKAITGRLKSVAAAGAKIAAVGLAAGASAFAAFSVKAASDLQETMNKFNVVFGKNATAVKKWGDEFAAQVGRSQEQIARFLSNAQDLLVPLGFEEGSATKMSQDLTELSLDLASFNNMADSDVMRDLQSALTGSGEVMKKYGVIVSEAAVKQQLLNDGLDPKNATDAQKVMARYKLILNGTTAAQGDATRSAGSFANQLKALEGKARDFAAAVGESILPVLSRWIDEAMVLAEALGSMQGSIDSTSQSTDGLTQSMEDGMGPLEAMVRVVAALKTVFLSARAGLNQLIIGLLRLVQLNAKIAQFAPSKAIRAMGRQAEEFADAMADSLAVSVEADSQAALKSGDVAFGDTLTKAIAKQRAELAKRRATRSNLGAGLDVGTDAVVGPKPDAVRESESTDRIVDAIADIPDAAIQLQQAQATSGTVGSFAGAAIERIASVQAQERELSNREKELAIQRQLAAQGKDANGMFEDMLQLQRDRLGGAFQ